MAVKKRTTKRTKKKGSTKETKKKGTTKGTKKKGTTKSVKIDPKYLKFFQILKKDALKEINSKAKYKKRKKTDQLTKKIMGREYIFKDAYDKAPGKLNMNKTFRLFAELDISKI
jgi:hypothetical protein